jgi:hypothetical protein
VGFFYKWERFDYYGSEDIGYAKVGGKWGVAIRTINGHSEDPDGENVEQWLFNDAPRLLRVSSIEKIPELLEALLKRAAEMTAKIIEKTKEVDAIVEAISSGVNEPRKASDRPPGLKGTVKIGR